MNEQRDDDKAPTPKPQEAPLSDTTTEPTSEPSEKEQSLTFLQLLSSTLSAAIGVQSKANKERDFKHGRASHFIMMGIGFTIVFVVLMASLVNWILSA